MFANSLIGLNFCQIKLQLLHFKTMNSLLIKKSINIKYLVSP